MFCFNTLLITGVARNFNWGKGTLFWWRFWGCNYDDVSELTS